MDRSEDLRGKPRDRYEARTLSSQSCKARQGKKARWAAGSTIRWLASLVPKVSRAVSRAAKDDGSCTAMRVTEGSQRFVRRHKDETIRIEELPVNTTTAMGVSTRRRTWYNRDAPWHHADVD